MDPRLFILKALHDALRRLPLDGFSCREPTWQDGEEIRRWSLQLSRGDASGWDTFLEQLANRNGFAPAIRDVLCHLDIVFRDADTDSLELALPEMVERLTEESRERLLRLLDQELLRTWDKAEQSHGTPTDDKRTPRTGKGEIMYIESKPGVTGEARIGRVFFSQTRKTLYYRDLVLQSLKGGGGLKANYVEVNTGMEYWISKCKKRGDDTLYPGVVSIDDDVREEYWIEVRKQPENRNVSTMRSAGKHGK